MIEVMIVVAIVGILASLAVPSLLGVAKANKVRSAVQEAAAVLDEARARAAAENRCFRVRASDASTLVIERRSTADCIDLGRDGWDAPVRTLKMPSEFELKITDTASVSGDDKIVFRPSGRLRGDGSLTKTEYGARLEVKLRSAADIATVDVTRMGRLCTALRGASVGALANPVRCP